ncbi:universal stress protein YxiE [Aplysia californica]|uniref:Universal stress protein YxiE n=1 Tax=Aplysia californica TaxID=6500 RepID=A0ABM0K4R8_APLCA|nr:universal stress protein YxiE [Aplysia californica]
MSEATPRAKNTVVIAMDGSEHSFYAFEWYMDFLNKPGDHLLVVHSPDNKSHLRTPVMSIDGSAVFRMVEKSEEEVNKIVIQIKDKLTKSGISARLMRLTGDAGHAIVKAADENKANLIITGSRGLGAVRRTLVGSVSNYVLHHAHCPVLVCQRKLHGHKSS